jgi:uncharacterized protein YgbK (DUF1537 family)
VRPPAILADDLTGALDTAAQFTGRWGPVAVHTGAQDAPVTAPAAISSETRELPAATAAALSCAAALAFGGGVTFRKVDSLLRGPWAAELAALHRAGGFTRCVLAPAFPAQGRVTVGGRQTVPGGPPIDIAAQLKSAGLGHGEGGPVRIADASSDADLAALVASERGTEPLWCGSAGLARALADAPPPRPALRQGPVLAVVGSDHPVARAQIEALAAARPGSRVRLRPGDRWARRANEGLRLVTFDLPPDTPRGEAARLIARLLAQVLPSLAPPGRLVASGGATLAAVLDAVGARRLACLGEFAPGSPVSRIDDGPWRGVLVLSKSGAFGGPTELVTMCLDVAERVGDGSR